MTRNRRDARRLATAALAVVLSALAACSSGGGKAADQGVDPGAGNPDADSSALVWGSGEWGRADWDENE